MPTDKELLDWLEEQNDKSLYSGFCVFRWSDFGRGWRLHEVSPEQQYAVLGVRQAIAQAMRRDEVG